jgi:Zn-dependent alcohol dehydrogenase
VSDEIRARAALFDAPGAPMRVEDIDVEAPGPGDVLVRMAAVGICGSDLHVVRGEWTRPVPMVLGHEGSGVVEAVGDEVDDLAVGDRVVVCWAPGCRHCAVCAEGRPAACPNLRAGFAAGTLPDGTTRLRHDGRPVYRMTAVGALATHVLMPRPGVLPVPPGETFAEAALLGCAAITGAGSVVNLAGEVAGATALVVGAGGVGQFAVQGLRLAGAERIVAVDPTPARRAAARELGATHAVAPEELSELLDELGTDAIDVAVEAVGRPDTVALATGSVRNGGTAILVGLPPAGAAAELDVADLVVREKRVVGAMYGGAEPAVTLERLYAGSERLELAGMLGPRFALEDVDEAVELALAGESGRVLVVPGGVDAGELDTLG